MILNRPGIDEEFKLLSINKPGPVTWNYTAEFIVNGATYPFAKVRFVNIKRDYKEDTAEIIMMGVKIDLRTYENLILPNSRNMDVILTRRLVSPNGQEKGSDPKFFRIYKSFLEISTDTKMTKSQRGGEAGAEDALASLLDINIQLVDKVAYEMSLTTASGVVRETSLKDIIRYYLSYGLGEIEIKKPLLEDEYQLVRGVDISPPTNSVDPDFFLIPSAKRPMPITDIPQYLQRTIGVYSAGMGYHFQNGWWHVYPLYDTKRYDSVKKNLTLLCVPEEELPVSERTYLYRDEQLYVFSTGERQTVDISEELSHLEGNVIRWWTASDLLDSMYKVKDNVATALNSETMKSLTFTKRSDGFNRVNHVPTTFTDNPYAITTKVLASQGRYLTTVWANCDYELLYPGMPSKILYVENGELIEVMGTLLKADIDIQPDTTVYDDNTFKAVAILTFYIDKDEKRLD